MNNLACCDHRSDACWVVPHMEVLKLASGHDDLYARLFPLDNPDYRVLISIMSAHVSVVRQEAIFYGRTLDAPICANGLCGHFVRGEVCQRPPHEKVALAVLTPLVGLDEVPEDMRPQSWPRPSWE